MDLTGSIRESSSIRRKRSRARIESRETMNGLCDLHRHLDGSLRASTVAELADRNGLDVPPDLPFFAGMGLDAALSRFAFTLDLLRHPNEVRRIANEMCEDAAREGVTTLEIRFAPQLHRGAPIPEIVDAAIDGAAGRAGILLCGLWGEPLNVMMELVETARTRRAVVGIDLAGGPSPTCRFGMADYAPAFARARELGIGRTVHAAEGRPAEEIRIAIEELFAERIGHGVTLLDEPAIVDLVLERSITIEACPTSNVHTSAIAKLEEHPLPNWLARGVRACVNTDNTLFSAVDAREEHRRARSIPGMTDAMLDRAIANGHAAAFRRRA
jgi:adenosine deaminase